MAPTENDTPPGILQVPASVGDSTDKRGVFIFMA